MSWKKVTEELPEEKKLVLVFRHKRKKYCIAARNEFIEEGIPKNSWVTEHGCCHSLNPEDVWISFPLFETVEKKVYNGFYVIENKEE